MKSNTIIYFSLLLILISSATSYSQISFSQNHPELIWRSFETEHFQIIYHQPIDKIAKEVARIAEQIYHPITNDLGIEPPGKTTIIVTDYLDYSNGLSTPLGHYIVLWTKSYTKYTTGRLRWLQTLVAHEFTHTVNFWAFRDFPGFWRELLALGFVPTWFLEGLAEYEAEKWCAHRDMLLRVVAYHHKLVPYKKMTGFIGADQIEARLVYEQGHSLIRYITSRFGQEKLKEIIQKYRSFPLSFNLALKRSIGLSEKQLFNHWRKEIQAHYGQEYQKHKPVSQMGKVLETSFQGNYGARWSPHGSNIALVAIKEYDEHIRELYLLNRKTGKTKKIAGPYVNSFFSWAPNGKHIVFSQKHIVPSGAEINDLFLVNIKTGDITQLTTNERASDPHFSPDGKRIVFTKHQGTKSNLAILNIETDEIHLITDFPDWTEVFTPYWSPDGKKIVFSIFDTEGRREICMIDADGYHFTYLTSNPEDDRYPIWSPDGKKIAFISYRTGIPNLYLKDVSTGHLTQLTDTPGGVFNPAWLPDGNQIAVIAFEKRDQTEIIILPIDDQPAAKKSHQNMDSLQFHYQHSPILSAQTSPSSLINSFQSDTPYHSIRNIRSQILLPYIDQDEKGYQPGMLNLFADPLGKHTLITTLSYRTRLHFSIDYTNRQFSPTIGFTFNKSTIDHGGFLKLENNQILPLYEHYWTGSLSFLWRLNFGKSLLSNHFIWTRYNFSYRKIINRSDYQENNIPAWAMPFQGWINYLTLGYSWQSYRPDLAYDIHPKTGYVLSIYGYYADPILLSELKFRQFNVFGIFRQELFKEQVVAIRTGALFRTGDQPIQSRLGMGSETIRGLEYSRSGDRQIYANVEYRSSLLRDLGLKIWIVYFERVCAALFFDIGKAWGSYSQTFYNGDKIDFSDADWTYTAGAELRHRFYILGKIPVVVSAGYGTNLTDQKERNFFLKLGSIF